MDALAPADCALFSRTSDDFESEIFLLSPSAAKWADALGGVWVDAPEALQHRWSILVAAGDVQKVLGINIGGKT